MTTNRSYADRSFPGSEEWTLASHGRDGVTPFSPRLTHSAEPSSPPGSPASPSTPTCATSQSAGAEPRGESPMRVSVFTHSGGHPTRESDVAGTLTQHTGNETSAMRPLVALTWDALNHTASPMAPTMGTNTGSATGRAGVVLTYSPSVAPAKTSPSPESDEDSTATAPAFSGRPCESPGMALFDPEPYSWRTWKGSCLATVDGTSPSSWTRWPSAGIGGATGFSTRSTSACPSGDAECSCAPSLTTILERNAPPRYSLSQKAAAGILRRATRRGRVLPAALQQALLAVADQVTP